MISVCNLSIAKPNKQGSHQIIERVDFDVMKGEIVAILGPNGSGKSTLLKALAGLQTVTSGQIILLSKDLKIGMVFQNASQSLYPWYSIKKQICMFAKISGCKSPELSAKKMVDLFGLGSMDHLFPYQLSGGLMQLVAMARTMVTKPDLLLLDEPFSSLDYFTTMRLLFKVRNIIKQEKSATIFVTHSPEEALLFADRILLLSKSPGKIVGEVDVKLKSERSQECVLDGYFVEQKQKLLSQLVGFIA
ncbi:MAG: ABC transporter ATP-binding protein [Candidatus Magasanikbacteria bacterium]|nr:ABC transporter ATP-binding protein [Candidatus Magasanikbacteria bacterium]